jgi:hypothetical protein
MQQIGGFAHSEVDTIAPTNGRPFQMAKEPTITEAARTTVEGVREIAGGAVEAVTKAGDGEAAEAQEGGEEEGGEEGQEGRKEEQEESQPEEADLTCRALRSRAPVS